MADEPLLAVKDLSTEFPTDGGPLRAVDRVSLSVRRGETVGIVGESGCGKTATALSILSLVPPPGRITSGQVLFKGEDLLRVEPERLRQIRGASIGMVFQEPGAALNPVLTVGEQVAEVVRAHGPGRPWRAGRARARQRALELLEQVGIPDAARRYSAFPHQLSGGMQQRVMLAIAMVCGPELLIADEPTSSLDLTTQAQIMALLGRLQRRHEMALLLITHDLALVAGVCDRVAVLYAGQVVERAAVAELFDRPAHPYTAALLGAVRSLAAAEPGARLQELPGAPDPAGGAARRGGCRFAGRCPGARPDCLAAPPGLLRQTPEHEVRCIHPLGEDGSPGTGKAVA